MWNLKKGTNERTYRMEIDPQMQKTKLYDYQRVGWGGMNWEIGIDTYPLLYVKWSFPSGSNGKESACIMGDLGLIPGSGRSSGEGNGNPLQCSCLENPLDRGAWWPTIYGVAESRTGLNN